MSFFNNLGGLWKKGAKKPVSIKPEKIEKPVKKVSPKVDAEFLLQAKTQGQEILLEAKEKAFAIKKESDRQLEETRQKIQQHQQQFQQKSAEIDRKVGILEEKSRNINQRTRELDKRAEKINSIKKQQLSRLEKISQLTKDKAKELLLSAWEKRLELEIGRNIREKEEEAKQTADEKAREILIEAMQKGAVDYVPEYTVSVVKLADEDIKGRIIGKEGRNIRTFEKITGVDTELDEEGIIRLSSFNSVRREIAKVSLEKLISDGRIQPSRIEEIVKKTKSDIQRLINKAGEDLCHQLKVYNLPRDVIEKLGEFKYRFSYGQSMITHTLEETKIGVSLAYEIGANVNITRLGCLLHDIGKVIADEEGSHVQLGVDFLKKYNMPQPIIDCVAQHHGDEDFTSVESVLVYIADAISGSRPGARYKDYDGYVSRLKKLESIASSFKGVKDAYAIQAGREVRVIVDPEKKNDLQSAKLAVDIKNKIKKEKVPVPGQIKVTVIRETRKTETI